MRQFGTSGGGLDAVAHFLRTLRRKVRELRFVHETGLTGSETHGQLRRYLSSEPAYRGSTEVHDSTGRNEGTNERLGHRG